MRPRREDQFRGPMRQLLNNLLARRRKDSLPSTRDLPPTSTEDAERPERSPVPESVRQTLAKGRALLAREKVTAESIQREYRVYLASLESAWQSQGCSGCRYCRCQETTESPPPAR